MGNGKKQFSDPDSAPSKRIEAATIPIEKGTKERRRLTRVEASQKASMTIRDIRYTVEVRDVSHTGAQLLVRRGLVPSEGQPVTLQFTGRRPIQAEVVWVNEGLVGLRFCDPIDDLSDVLHFEDLGVDFFRAVLRYCKS